MEVSGQLHAPRRFTPGERTSGTRRMGGLVDLSRCGRFVEERNMSRVPGTEPERSSQQHAPSVSLQPKPPSTVLSQNVTLFAAA